MTGTVLTLARAATLGDLHRPTYRRPSVGTNCTCTAPRAIGSSHPANAMCPSGRTQIVLASSISRRRRGEWS